MVRCRIMIFAYTINYQTEKNGCVKWTKIVEFTKLIVQRVLKANMFEVQYRHIIWVSNKMQTKLKID